MRFSFGERILVKGYIQRHKHLYKREWRRFDYPRPEEAIFLGHRTLSNGEIESGPDQWDFAGDKYIPGAWICREGKNPEKVFLEDCIKLKQVTFTVFNHTGYSVG